MTLRQRLTEAGSTVAGAGAAARGALGTRLPPVPDEATVQAWLSRLPVPTTPATATWTLSIGALLGQVGSIPPLAVKALGLLDRFGRVSVGPDKLGIDGDDVQWRSMTAIRTTPVTAMLGRRLVLDELKRIKGLVSPMPGRSIVLAQAGTVLGGLLGRALAGEAMPCRDIVSAVECTGRLGRQRTVQLGLAGSLVLMALPEVDRSIRATAELHRIPVMSSPTGAADPVSADSFRRLVGDGLGRSPDQS